MLYEDNYKNKIINYESNYRDKMSLNNLVNKTS